MYSILNDCAQKYLHLTVVVTHAAVQTYPKRTLNGQPTSDAVAVKKIAI